MSQQRRKKTPWLFRLPNGLQHQPESVFIGLLCVLTGLSYAVGLSSSNRLTERLNPTYLKAWGGFLLISGLLIIYSVIREQYALEILSRRFLSICIAVFLVWITLIVGVTNAAITVMLGTGLIVLGEIRIAVLKLFIRSVSR